MIATFGGECVRHTNWTRPTDDPNFGPLAIESHLRYGQRSFSTVNVKPIIISYLVVWLALPSREHRSRVANGWLNSPSPHVVCHSMQSLNWAVVCAVPFAFERLSGYDQLTAATVTLETGHTFSFDFKLQLYTVFLCGSTDLQLKVELAEDARVRRNTVLYGDS